eukprot:6117537-Amphidinium_carterae.1
MEVNSAPVLLSVAALALGLLLMGCMWHVVPDSVFRFSVFWLVNVAVAMHNMRDASDMSTYYKERLFTSA